MSRTDELIREVASSYREAGLLARRYLSAKLRIDPVHRAALELAPASGTFVDLGCGSGQLSLLLAMDQPERSILGIDSAWDRIDRARRAAARRPGLALRYLVSDVRLCPIPSCDVALLIDVLHYLGAAEQDQLLRRVARALRPGGLILVREVDRAAAARWRYALTALEELLTVNLGWTPASGELCFRPVSALATVLESCGLTTELEPMSGRTPFANVLCVAREEPISPRAEAPLARNTTLGNTGHRPETRHPAPVASPRLP